MLTAHNVNAFLVLAAAALTVVVGGIAYRRNRAGAAVAQLIALVQTLIVAQVGLGLLLLSDHRRAPDKLHYAYGSFALAAVLAPWLYAPADPRRRLLWFTGATLVAGALATRAYLTAAWKKLFDRINPTVRGLLIVALIALVVVVFQLYTTLGVVAGLLRIAFFLAIAFFVYLLWRDQRSNIDLWSNRARRVFYAAALLIVIDLGAFFSPFRKVSLSGFPAFAFIAVLVICGFSMWRIWKDEHTYG